ncbi:LANO_0F02894g1_1 [Lachancea nothofagi CBS 11611]|uniref:precorrin-2 dehydrogenase n=1 Tax=Lachancea nothofagi CBS 11611 TaxID=1266666 RepID=A0A1G4K6X3_9SACH|nr:LANO_0F02894g1_1 [Lachancea nothofagi CBS 11611]
MLSLQLAHQLVDKNVLLVGAGDVAMTRIPKLLPTGCKLTIIAPEIHEDMWEYIDVEKKSNQTEFIDHAWDSNKNKIYQIIQRGFENKDIVLFGTGLSHQEKIDEFFTGKLKLGDCLDMRDSNPGWHLIMTCIPNPVLSEYIYQGAKLVLGKNVLCNVADNPPLCDFYFGSNVILGDGEGNKPIQILISSNGNSPRFTSLLKQEIQDQYGNLPIGKSVSKLGKLRSQIRQNSEQNCPSDLSQLELIKYRMEWIRNCTDAFGVAHCHEINIDKTLKLFDEMFADLSLEQPEKKVFLEEYLENSS